MSCCVTPSRASMSSMAISHRSRLFSAFTMQYFSSLNLILLLRLMPAVSKYTIKEVIDAARYFAETSGRRVTLEYVLLKGENTSLEDARRLGKISRRGPFKLNLIPYNPGRDGGFETLGDAELQEFIQELLPYSPTITVRRSKGTDIFAACGQLWTQNLAPIKKPAEGT